MVLCQLQLAYLYHYLEISFTVLQNNRVPAFVNLGLSHLKHQEVEKQHQQNRYINQQKSIMSIYWVYHWLGIS